MFCTRWFTPLFILPLPITPSYILVLYIISTALHAQACFNCIIVLTALFFASCYWQPVSIDTPLYTPWSENITTFSQALDTMLPANLTIDKPPVIQFVDRCWCDLSSTVFFSPFNVTKWELDSMERYVEEIVREHKREPEVEDVQPDSKQQNHSSSAGQPESTLPLETAEPRSPTKLFQHVFSLLFAKSVTKDQMSDQPSPMTLPSNTSDTHDCEMTRTGYTAGEAKQGKAPWYMQEYSLHPYGFDVILEFGWDKNVS